MYPAEVAKRIKAISPKNDKTLIALKFKKLMCQRFKGRIQLNSQDEDKLYYSCHTPWGLLKASVKGVYKREVYFQFDQWDKPLYCPLLPEAEIDWWETLEGYLEFAGYFIESPLPCGWKDLELDEGPQGTTTLTGTRQDGRVIEITLPCR